MALQSLAHVVARAPCGNKLLGSLVYAEVVVHQHLNLQLIAHEVVGVSGAEAAIDDYHGPVGDAVHAHADMFGKKIVCLSRELKPAECNGCCDQENRTARRLRCAYQWRHFGL